MNLLGDARRKFRIAGTLTVGLAVFLASCGTLLHPERRGQPAGRLDPGIVVLDGIGLLLFFVPGVIAFVVDFSTGAIYLPPDYSLGIPLTESELCAVPVDPAALTARHLAAIVQEQTGKTVDLRPGEYRAMRLQKLDDFTPATVAGLESESSVARVVFRANDD